jgi:hypothetical protein
MLNHVVQYTPGTAEDGERACAWPLSPIARGFAATSLKLREIAAAKRQGRRKSVHSFEFLTRPRVSAIMSRRREPIARPGAICTSP